MENIVWKIMRLSWPVMIGTILQSLVYTFDLFFLSKLGTAFASAASIGTSAAGIVFVTASLVAVGTVALVSRAKGEEDEEKIKTATGTGLLLSIVFGILIGFLGQIFAHEIVFYIYGVKDVVTLKLTTDYLIIVLVGTGFVFINFTLRSVLQGIGNTKTPLWVFGISNVLNIVLNPIFIFKLQMGMKGAAWATVISMLFGTVLILYKVNQLVFKEKKSRLFSYLKMPLEKSLSILRVGGWACIQQISRPITGMLMYAIVLRAGGNSAVAAFGIGGQLFSYTFIFLSGLSTGVAILTGQMLGRGEKEKVIQLVRKGLILASGNMVIFFIPYILFPRTFFKLFLQDPAVIEVGVQYLRIIYIGLIFVIFPVIYGGVFQGSGYTRPYMVSSLVANLLFKVPVAGFLAIKMGMGTDGVWWAVSGSVVVEAIVSHMYMKKDRWRHHQVE